MRCVGGCRTNPQPIIEVRGSLGGYIRTGRSHIRLSCNGNRHNQSHHMFEGEGGGVQAVFCCSPLHVVYRSVARRLADGLVPLVVLAITNMPLVISNASRRHALSPRRVLIQ